MSLELVEWAVSWPLMLPYFEGSVPAGFPSPAEAKDRARQRSPSQTTQLHNMQARDLLIRNLQREVCLS
jgi:hypothetical protein